MEAAAGQSEQGTAAAGLLAAAVGEDEREMMREGCNAAEVWRVSEVRGLDQMHIREAARAGGSLEELAGKGEAGEAWGAVTRRVAAPLPIASV